MESVRTRNYGFGEHSGKALFDHIGNDELKNEWFNKAMTSASKMQIPSLLSSFPFEKYGYIIDIGGGEGLFLAKYFKQGSKKQRLVV